jgi:demethylmenaquinone methyltransferase/2-methoxy-6-polyprenyl-1,4-benzoquinol methylase
MATILRDWSYRYQWLYDGISRFTALSVGGEARFRQLALQGLTIHSDTQVLDLCCGSGQTTQFLVKLSQNVTGLDASPKSLQRARLNVPEASYVEAFAEEMPFADNLFDVVHISLSGVEARRGVYAGGFSRSDESGILAWDITVFVVV